MMAIDDWIKVIDSVTKLAGVLVWPALIVFVVYRLGPSLKDFLANLSDFSLKGGGFEASAKRTQVAVAAALAAAASAHPEPGTTPEMTAKDAKAAADVVAEIVTPRAIRRARKATVLWVDDKPDNNVHERQSLEALGVTFVISMSTDDALSKIKAQRFDAIISDMSRPGDNKAGYTLLDRLRASGNRTPYVIYAGTRASADRAEARRRGALGTTDRPDELFDMVVSALSRGA